MSVQVAYLVNHYPKVSHSFIRREILALERLGIEVVRIGLRGWDSDLVDPDDLRERERTRYVLQHGALPMLAAAFAALLRSPGRFFAALALTLKLGWRADRPLPYHFVYFIEACLVARWLHEQPVQHMHAHFGTNSAEVAMLVHALGGPSYSFTVHGPEEFDKPAQLKLRDKMRHAAFVVAISSYARSQLYRLLDGGDWHKVQEVHCGLDDGFHDVAATAVPAVPRFVCVGRICEQKGQLLLVQAAHGLARQGVDFELVLAGDGEMRAEVEALIAQLQLGSRVRITGWIGSDQVRSEILASRALVLPSFAEGLPVVLMEAMALRRPVITTYVAGIPELVRPGVDGWLVPAGDIQALTTAMKQCLSESPARLSAMGERARARVLAQHSVDVEAAKLAELIRRPGQEAQPQALEIA